MRRRIPHRTVDGEVQKYCKKCDNWFFLTEFNQKKVSYDGLETKCKKCAQKKSAAFRKDNPSYDKSYQEKNLERLRDYKKEYYNKKKLEDF